MCTNVSEDHFVEEILNSDVDMNAQGNRMAGVQYGFRLYVLS